MTRRDLLRYLLSAPIAAQLDVEKLLWVPTPMVTVPELTRGLTVAQIVGVTYPLVMRRLQEDLSNMWRSAFLDEMLFQEGRPSAP